MAETENTWRKREAKQITCPSGNVITVRRPGPDLALKSGRITRIFHKQDPKDANDLEKQMAFIESLPDAELQAVMDFARILVADVVISPPLSLHPKEGQLGPDDVPLNDFWFIFAWGSNGGPDMPVKMKEGETTLENVSNFPEGQSAGLDVSEDSGIVQ